MSDNNIDASSASLDTLPAEELTWTFYTADSDVRYTVPIKVAQLSGTFSNMIKSSQNERAVSLQIVSQTLEGTDKVYLINTNHLLSYVYRYFKLWENSPDNSDYVKEEPVQTSEIHHLLRNVDIILINEYLDEYLKLQHVNENTDDCSKVRMAKKEALGILLSQVDEFLDIKCFAKKIYAYIGALIWNTSLIDFAEAMQDPKFRAAQQAAVEAWKLDNDSYFANYIRSQNVETISLAPMISKEQLKEYSEFVDAEELAAKQALDDSDSDSDDSDLDD